MDFGQPPLGRVLAGSLALAPALVGLESRPKLAGAFIGLFFAGLSGWLTWKIILYPHFFSPFRDLPSPPGTSIWNGHFAALTIPHNYRSPRDW